jgi:hypothetical protein
MACKLSAETQLPLALIMGMLFSRAKRFGGVRRSYATQLGRSFKIDNSASP